MKKSLIAALVAALALCAPTAEAKLTPRKLAVPPGGKLILCTLRQRGKGNWIPTELVLLIDKAGGVLVYDAIIDAYYDAPIAAEVQTDNARRTTYAWSVEGTRDRTKQYAPNLDYRLTVQKDGGKASIAMSPRNYANRFFGDGVCKQK